MMPANNDLYSQAEAAYGRNDLAAAEKLCNLILTAKPTDLPATILIGIVQARLGKTPFAISYLKKALRYDPDSFEAHIALSTVLCRSGKAEEGLDHGRQAIRIQPRDPDGYIHQGMNLKGLKRLNEAVNSFRAALEVDPTHQAAAQNLAAALQESRRDLEAKAAWNAVVALNPKSTIGWLSLGQLHLMLGEFADAISCARMATELDPRSGQAQLLLALALSEAGESVAAEKHIREAIRLDPKDGIALAALGFWLQEQGDFIGSIEALERAIKILPTHGFAYYNLFRCKKATQDDTLQLIELMKLANSDKLLLSDRSYLNYALGKAFEDLGEYHGSMKFYDAANEAAHKVWLEPKPWDVREYKELATKSMEFFDKGKLANIRTKGNTSSKPILIVGMMRSGTSLMEQILSAHPEIGGGGELTFWHERADAIFNASHGQLSEIDLQAASEQYVERLSQLAPNKKHVTDKLPHNYALLGMIHGAVPNAKIVHVRRNPIDNCLSIYTTAYQRPPVFAHNRENIVVAYREYQRYMNHWKQTLPEGSMIEVEYEDLVMNCESVTRRIVDFLGLEWSDQCLHHEQNKRSVRTPSLWQVRQPVYATSMERWRRFEPWIAPFDNLD